MDILLEQHLDYIEAPANLRINDQINQYRDICRKHGCERPYHPSGPTLRLFDTHD